MPSSPVIVAYDGSANARDAVALGRVLASACDAPLALASTYRPAPGGPRDGEGPARERDRFMRERTQELLVEAAFSLGVAEGTSCHPVASPTTAGGMRALAEREHAIAVVFGSARGTPPGRVHPGSASRRLLQGLGSALAFAPVGFAAEHPADRPAALTALAVADDDPEQTARGSARALAQRTGARLLDDSEEPRAEELSVFLLGSAPHAPAGQLAVNARASELIQSASAPVLVLPRGRALLVAAAVAA